MTRMDSFNEHCRVGSSYGSLLRTTSGVEDKLITFPKRRYQELSKGTGLPASKLSMPQILKLRSLLPKVLGTLVR